MLDLLSVLESAGLLERTWVVSSNRQVLAYAESAGANTLVERRDSGVNSAVTAAVSTLRSRDEFMVLPADLPLLEVKDVRSSLALRGGGLDVVISPSRGLDGTNLLVFSRKRPLALSYDADSFWNHLICAGRERLRAAVYATKTVMLDLDTPRDLGPFLRSRADRKSVEYLQRISTTWAS